MSARHPCCARLARIPRTEGHGTPGSPILIFFVPVPRRPCAAIFGVSRPALHGRHERLPSAPRRSQPVEAGGPVVVPDGRITRRLHLFHASRFRRVRVSAKRRLQEPPEARAG